MTGDQVYLRKEVLVLAKQIDKSINNENLESKGVLNYNSITGVATVNLNYRTRYYSSSTSPWNADNKNNRLVVNKRDLWYDLIGNEYTSPTGGTWYPNNPSLLGGTVQILYVPKYIAQTYYNAATRPDIMEPMYDVYVSAGIDAAAEWLSTQIATKLGVNPHMGMVILLIQTYTAAQKSYYNKYLSDLLDSIEACGANQFVCIKTTKIYQIQQYGGYYMYIPTSSVYTGTIFKDEYPSTGRFDYGNYNYWSTYIL